MHQTTPNCSSEPRVRQRRASDNNWVTDTENAAPSSSLGSRDSNLTAISPTFSDGLPIPTSRQRLAPQHSSYSALSTSVESKSITGKLHCRHDYTVSIIYCFI